MVLTIPTTTITATCINKNSKMRIKCIFSKNQKNLLIIITISKLILLKIGTYKVQGTIIILDQNKQEGLIESATVLYKFKLSDELAKTPIQVGDIAEFDIIKPKQKFFGIAKILSTRPLHSDYVYVSTDNNSHHDDVTIIDINTKVSFVAEGKCAKLVFGILEEEASLYNANALLNLKLEVIKRPLNHNYLFRYSANLAQVKSDRYKLESGLHLKIDESKARLNYANDVAIRYYRVLIASFLLIFIPCMFALASQGKFSIDMAKAISTSAIILGLFYGYKINPRSYKSYLKKPRHGLFS